MEISYNSARKACRATQRYPQASFVPSIANFSLLDPEDGWFTIAHTGDWGLRRPRVMAQRTRGKVVPLREDSIVEHRTGPDVRTAFEALRLGGPQPFPIVPTQPKMPLMIPDEILEYYGWVFCQGGFLNLQMTFEQFLTVVAAVSPASLCPEYDGAESAHLEA
jgi:hypothetical protein